MSGKSEKAKQIDRIELDLNTMSNGIWRMVGIMERLDREQVKSSGIPLDDFVKKEALPLEGYRKELLLIKDIASRAIIETHDYFRETREQPLVVYLVEKIEKIFNIVYSILEGEVEEEENVDSLEVTYLIVSKKDFRYIESHIKASLTCLGDDYAVGPVGVHLRRALELIGRNKEGATDV